MSTFTCMGSQLWFALGRHCSFSPCEPDPVVYVTLSDVWDYLPGPTTPDNSLEG